MQPAERSTQRVNMKRSPIVMLSVGYDPDDDQKAQGQIQIMRNCVSRIRRIPTKSFGLKEYPVISKAATTTLQEARGNWVSPDQ